MKKIKIKSLLIRAKDKKTNKEGWIELSEIGEEIFRTMLQSKGDKKRK